MISMLLILMLSAAAMAGTADNYKTWNLVDYEAETGVAISVFNEAPALAERVAAGELPPVAERLPVNPLVVQTMDEIGTYGGQLRGWGLNPESFGNDVWVVRTQRVIDIYPNWQTLAPSLITDYAFNEDNTAITLHLREGLRWSDGELVTADDFVFWMDDVANNKELNPSVPSNWVVAGEPIQITKIDDLTIRYDFAAPYPLIVEVLAGSTQPFAPKHYLSQFHIEYNSDAGELAQANGYDEWYQYYEFMANTGDLQNNPDRPVVDPWAFTRADQYGNKYYERNPYYWKIDTAGNQLPYIDSQVRLYIPDKEQVILRAMAGDLDYGSNPLQIDDLPVLRDGEQRGGYETLVAPSVFGTQRRYQFNLTTENEALREVFNDIRFRKAMSLAIDRDEVNRTLFFGLGTPRQYTTPSVTPFYEDWMGEYYAQYDPEKAAQLLDEMGLGWDRNQRYRLLPNGDVLEFELADSTRGEVELTEMVISFWDAIGVKADYRTMTRELFVERAQANDLEASVWFGDAVDEFRMRELTTLMRPPWGLDTVPKVAPPWRQWFLTSGEQGEEPPQEIKDLNDAMEQFLQTVKGTDEYMEAGRTFLEKSVSGLYALGVVGETPRPVIIKSTLRNFPKDMTWVDHMRGTQADQWFWD